jgi:hypothetical protein
LSQSTSPSSQSTRLQSLLRDFLYDPGFHVSLMTAVPSRGRNSAWKTFFKPGFWKRRMAGGSMY